MCGSCLSAFDRGLAHIASEPGCGSLSPGAVDTGPLMWAEVRLTRVSLSRGPCVPSTVAMGVPLLRQGPCVPSTPPGLWCVWFAVGGLLAPSTQPQMQGVRLSPKTVRQGPYVYDTALCLRTWGLLTCTTPPCVSCACAALLICTCFLHILKYKYCEGGDPGSLSYF